MSYLVANPENRFSRDVAHIWTWRPSWLCDINHMYSLIPPSHGDSTLNLASIGLAVSKEKKMSNLNDLGPRSMNDLDL